MPVLVDGNLILSGSYPIAEYLEELAPERPFLGAGHAEGRISRPLRHNGTPYRGVNVLLLWGEAQTIGTGTAYVFTAGVLVRGTWTRADRTSAFELRDDSGAVIALTPGRTWVELARANHTTPTD